MIRNPFAPKPLNSLAPIRCPFAHVKENPHPEWRWTPGVGWFRWPDEAQAFLFDAKGPDDHSTIEKPSERSQIIKGKHSYIWCALDWPQVTLESIPGWNHPATLANKHTGLGAHLHSHANPDVLRHYRSYAGYDINRNAGPTERSGRWVYGEHSPNE